MNSNCSSSIPTLKAIKGVTGNQSHSSFTDSIGSEEFSSISSFPRLRSLYHSNSSSRLSEQREEEDYDRTTVPLDEYILKGSNSTRVMNLDELSIADDLSSERTILSSGEIAANSHLLETGFLVDTLPPLYRRAHRPQHPPPYRYSSPYSVVIK
jgi:hypothetical protein